MVPVVLAVTLAAVAAIAAAAVSADATIHACKNLRHGLVRLVAGPAACKSNETPVSWSEHGPPGPAGPAGPAGPPGPAGTSGLASVQALAGTPCTTFEGSPGRVEIGVSATDLILLTCETGAAPGGEGASNLVINEVDYDQVGADENGFVEIANTGPGPASLDGLAIVLVNGGDGTEYGRKSLSGSLAPGGHLAVDVDLQNGAPDAVALLAGTTLLDALSYEGAVGAAVVDGATFDLVEGAVLPVEIADSNDAAGSLSRIPDGADSDDNAADWKFTTTVTRGGPNILTP